MPLKNPSDTDFENEYTPKFETLARKYGYPIDYRKDVAAIDLGLHLKTTKDITNTRVWFQLKGLHEETLPKKKFESLDFITYKVKIEHLRSWYNSSEAVYMVLYIESVGAFIAEDIRDVVAREWGEEILNNKVFKPRQKTVTIKLKKQFIDNKDFWEKLYSHKSMRVDGFSYRGRPLGHSYNPQTTSLAVMQPELFEEIIEDLLKEHGFRQREILDVGDLFSDKSKGDKASLIIGKMYQKYEVFSQLLTEFGCDEDGYSEDTNNDFHQGDCAIFIHSKVHSLPDQTLFRQKIEKISNENKISRLLVFSNSPLWGNEGSFGHYRVSLENLDIGCLPQHIDDLSYNFFTTTNTYQKFKDKVNIKGGKIWRKENEVYILPVDSNKKTRWK